MAWYEGHTAGVAETEEKYKALVEAVRGQRQAQMVALANPIFPTQAQIAEVERQTHAITEALRQLGEVKR